MSAKKRSPQLPRSVADQRFAEMVQAVRAWIAVEHRVCPEFHPARMIEIVEYDTDGTGDTLCHFSGTDDNPYTIGDLRALGITTPDDHPEEEEEAEEPAEPTPPAADLREQLRRDTALWVSAAQSTLDAFLQKTFAMLEELNTPDSPLDEFLTLQEVTNLREHLEAAWSASMGIYVPVSTERPDPMRTVEVMRARSQQSGGAP